jgi:hypothetical protein
MSATGYIKPPWAARVIGTRLARLFKPQIVQVLSVRGRALPANPRAKTHEAHVAVRRKCRVAD